MLFFFFSGNASQRKLMAKVDMICISAVSPLWKQLVTFNADSFCRETTEGAYLSVYVSLDNSFAN